MMTHIILLMMITCQTAKTVSRARDIFENSVTELIFLYTGAPYSSVILLHIYFHWDPTPDKTQYTSFLPAHDTFSQLSSALTLQPYMCKFLKVRNQNKWPLLCITPVQTVTHITYGLNCQQHYYWHNKAMETK